MGSLDAGLAGLFDYLLKDRETIKAQERDDKQWETRERLRARIGLDTDKEKASLQEKRGDAYQAEDGTWIVPLYDGFGRQKGTAPATTTEQAVATQAQLAPEATRLNIDKGKWEAENRDDLLSLDKEAKRAGINSTNVSAAATASGSSRAQQSFNEERSGAITPAALTAAYNKAYEAIAYSGAPASIVNKFQTAYNSAATPGAKMQVAIEYAARARAAAEERGFDRQKELKNMSGGLAGFEQ